MTYTIPADSPKAVRAAAFGRELVKALAARDVSIKQIERVTGVGHTSIDNYRRGLILPKVEVARTLAATLNWPRLAEMILAARTFTCARNGCSRTFRNDTGAPRKFCSEMCRRIAENQRLEARRNRAAGRDGTWSSADTAAQRRARQTVAIADEHLALMASAIEAMCRGCEPEGICRTAECPLRPFSPLPLPIHEAAEPRTVTATLKASWTPERRERFVAALDRRWAEPGAREAAAADMRQRHRDHPEYADRTRAGVARRTPESFSAASKKAWETRRAATGASSS